jgi:putative ATP-dependent endonuclease of OLD family
MRIHSIRIQNFRAFKDVIIPVNNYACFVGPNGAGKSTVLCALNVFFRSTEHSPLDLTCLEEEDFFQKNCSEPIRITVKFTELDAEAQKDFSAYFRNGELVISAEARYDAVTKTAEVKQFGERNVIKAFAPFFEAVKAGKKVAELTALFDGIRTTFSEVVKAKTKDQMIDALNAFENAHPELCELLPSEDEFYGVSKGTDRLAKYIQWVFVPAVKDATSEQAEGKDTALGKILERTVRSKVNFAETIKALRENSQEAYRKLLAANQGALNDISASLGSRLANWAHPETTLRLEWRQDIDKAVKVEHPFAEIVAGEGKFEGNLARFGHGLQRSYLLALLQELSGSADSSGPKLILAIEEPELYQHPPQARHLAEVLKQLSKENSQVLVCTHSPFFVAGEGFEDVRLVRKHNLDSSADVSFVAFTEIAKAVAKAKEEGHVAKATGMLAKINQELQPSISEMFFTPFLILVEGLEDCAFITTYLHLMGKWDEYRRLGAHIVAAGGKSHMVLPLAIVQKLKIPTFVVFDSDGDEINLEKRLKHEKDNKAIETLCDATITPFPTSISWEKNLVVWPTRIGVVVEKEFEAAALQKYQSVARNECGHIKDLEKNSIFIAEWLSAAWDDGKKSPSLEKLCNEILNFGKGSSKISAGPTF